MSATVEDPLLDAVLEDIDDDLGFVSALVARLRARGTVDVEPLERAVRAVEERRRDTALYLALVGEFSSGKTTFVNALLGEPLLESSPLANTAAVTEIRQGARRAMRVRFRDDGHDLEFPSAALDARLAARNRRMDSLEQVLSTLTADPEVARVCLEHPSPLLGDDIVVLDTPGVNADHGHTAAALEVVAEDADAFVVLIAGHAPLSLSLQALLREHLGPYLHRTTFVVTHMRHLDAQERPLVVGLVERRLRDALGLEAPVVVAASLGAALRARLGEAGATPEDREWLRAFEALRAELVARLRRERTVTVAERVIVLLREALALAEASLHHERTALRRRAEVLERNPPADLDRFCARHRRDLAAGAVGATAVAGRAAQKAIAAAEEACVAELESALKKATASAALDRVLAGAPTVVERHVDRAQRAAKPSATQLSRAIGQLAKDFDARFQTEFAGLKLLAGGAFRPRAASAPKVESARVSADALALKQKLDQTTRRAAGAGAGVGAAIGRIIAPGIGTLIGAGLGGLLGSGGGPSLERRRTTYWAELEPGVRAVFRRLDRQYAEMFATHSRKAAAYLEAHVDRYHDSYGQAIRELRAAHAAALVDVRDQAAQTRRDAAEVQTRIGLLRRRSDVLAGLADGRRVSG